LNRILAEKQEEKKKFGRQIKRKRKRVKGYFI